MAEAAPRVLIFGYDQLVDDTIAIVEEGGGCVAGVVFPSARMGDPRVRRIRDRTVEGGRAILEQPAPAGAAAFEAEVRVLAPDLILSWSYPMRLTRPVLEVPRLGSLNLHMGLLPEYRGAHALQWAIVNGETITGVTLHRMEETLDTGPVLARARFAIHPADDIVSVLERAREAGIRLLREGWPHFSTRVLDGVPQDPDHARTWPPRTAADDRIDWASAAVDIRNLVRATAAPFPGAFTTWRDERLVVRACESAPPHLDERPGTILGLDEGGITVATAVGSLRLTRLELGGTPIDTADLARKGMAAGQRFD